MLNRLKFPLWCFPCPAASPVSLAPPWCPQKSYNPNPKRLLYRPLLKNVPLTPARAPPRRVQCVCQNEVEKIRPAYRLNPKSFGLMTPIRLLRVSVEGGTGWVLEQKSFFVSKKIGGESPPRQGNPQIMSNH